MTPRYDPDTMAAAAKVVTAMANEPKRWGSERKLLLLAAQRILAIQQKSDE